VLKYSRLEYQSYEFMDMILNFKWYILYIANYIYAYQNLSLGDIFFTVGNFEYPSHKSWARPYSQAAIMKNSIVLPACTACIYIVNTRMHVGRKPAGSPISRNNSPPSLRGTTEMASVGGTHANCSSSVTLGVAHLVNKDSAKAALWSVKRRRTQVFP
jgi:hypothetical protein